MDEHEKELLRLYLKEKKFPVDVTPPEILERFYEYCAVRLNKNGDYAAAFESLLHTIHAEIAELIHK